MTSHRWKRFFMEAGLPSDIADHYAIIFTDNRIRFDMLDELNKEILYDMKIKKLGDVISILRHAKEVSANSKREKLFNNNNNDDDGGSGGSDKNHKSTASIKFNQPDFTMTSSNSVSKQSSNDNMASSSSSSLQMKRIVKNPSPKRIVKAPQSNDNISMKNTMLKTTTTTIKTNVVYPKRSSSPTIIRNVTGLNAVLPTIRKRIEPPSDDDNDINNNISPSKISKTISNPDLRNRIETQTRLRKFSSQIQDALISNASNNISPLQQQQQQQQSIHSRLNIPKNDILFVKKPIQSRNVQITRNSFPLSSSTSSSYASVKDRLGNKNVFARIGSTTASPQPRSIHQRLGNR